MSEKYPDAEIDRLLNASHCPALPLKEIVRQLRAERDSRTAEIREYLRQCEGNAEDNIEDSTADEFLEWNAVSSALHDILREFDRRWPTK